jgi:hypothetical protein
MSENLAANYADELAAQIWARSEAGAPYGWVLAETGEQLDDEPTPERVESGEVVECEPMDYLGDVYSFEYRVTGDREYLSARLMIAGGGPNAWIDTQDGTLVVTWWSAPEVRTLPADFVDGLDEAARELWEAGA